MNCEIPGGGTRTRTTLRSTDFRTHFGFRRLAFRRVRGLDSAFTPVRCRGGVRPVEPLHLPTISRQLGSALPQRPRPSQGSPTLRRSTPGVAAGALKSIKSVASAISPRPVPRMLLHLRARVIPVRRKTNKPKHYSPRRRPEKNREKRGGHKTATTRQSANEIAIARKLASSEPSMVPDSAAFTPDLSDAKTTARGSQ